MALETAKAQVILRTLTAKFDNKLMAAKPFWPTLCLDATSDGYDEQYGFLGGMPGMREFLGSRIFKEFRAANYTIVNKLWENSALLEKTRMDDDRWGIYVPVMEQLAIEAGYHPDELLFENLIVNGDSTVGWDGQYFFDTDHAWGDSGSQSNDLTYDATSHTAVTSTEFKAAFLQARQAMMNFRNDQGKLLNRPIVEGLTGLVAVVPTELEQAAREAFAATIIGNTTNVVYDVPRIVVSPHLTSAVEWYLFKTDLPLKPFIMQKREPLSRQMKGLTDLEEKDVKFMTQARYNLGYGAWWTAVMTTFN